jgi:DNA-binding NarL/FixJ family response regulator
MEQQTTIVMADDHPIFRQGLRQVIEREGRFQVLAEAQDGAEAWALIQRHQPQIALVDLDMPELDGFGVARRVQAEGLPVAVVILTMHKDELHFNQAIDLGVRGYIVKDGAASEVVHCLRLVARGQEYISPVLSTYLLNRTRRTAQTHERFGFHELTPAERRVLALLADLKTTKEIAGELCVSPRTVDAHRAHIAAKLNLSGAHALTKFALEHRSQIAVN